MTVFQELKLKKKYRYITFNLSKDLTEIIVEKTGDEGYEEFISLLPENECRWAIYDFEFEKEDGGRRNKIVFLSW
jgi:cofilin